MRDRTEDSRIGRPKVIASKTYRDQREEHCGEGFLRREPGSIDLGDQVKMTR